MRNSTRLLPSLFCTYLLLSTLSCSSNSTSSLPTYNLQGSITVVGEKPDFAIGKGQQGGLGDDCFTGGGYSDIAEGMEVVVKNGKDETLAIGRLSGGKFTKAGSWDRSCTFNFSVQNIPETSFYVIQTGGRGEKQYSLSEMQQSNWNLEYSLR